MAMHPRHTTDPDVPRLLSLVLTKLLDEHYLAAATLLISDLEDEMDGRTLLVGADYSRNQVHLRVCAEEDQQAQMARIRAACIQED